MIILSHTTQLISQYSKYAISWEMQEIYFEHQQGQETFLLSTASRQVRWPTRWVLGVLFPGVTQQWNKANHPPHLVPRLRIHTITHPLPHKLSWYANRQLYFTIHMTDTSGFGGLGVACWPLVPKFAGPNPAEAVRFLGRKNPQHAFPRRGSKADGPMS